MTPVASPPTSDPSRRIETAFEHVAQTRMRDLPFVNPRLRVAAVGFRRWQSGWIGVLVTPWGINLLHWPGPDARVAPASPGSLIEIALPGAIVPFMPAQLETLGEFGLCSLFSPAQQFADQETALATADETLRLLFDPARSASAPSRRRMLGLRG